MLMILGYATLVIALVFVVASVAALHIERKQLLAAADGAALAAASALDVDAYYRGGGANVVVSNTTVRAAVVGYLAGRTGSPGLEDVRIESPTGTADGRNVVVSLSALARIPLIPSLADHLPELIRVRVTAGARAG